MYISHKFLKSSVNELLEFRHISKINTCIFLSMWQLKHCFDLSHLYIHTQTREHTHTHTHTHTNTQAHAHSHSHRLKFGNFLERWRNQIHEQLRQYWPAKFNSSEIQVF